MRMADGDSGFLAGRWRLGLKTLDGMAGARLVGDVVDMPKPPAGTLLF